MITRTQPLPSVGVAGPAATTARLQRLYLVRFGFAVAWAAALLGVGSSLGAASVALLVLYPAFDLAAAVVDVRFTRSRVLYANIAISAAAAVGLAVASAADIPAVLRVWGAWASAAGLVQLAVALRRRGLGGQWALILSGSLSVVVGLGFVAQAGGATSLSRCAGYAALGGVFFLASAIRLQREGRRSPVTPPAASR